MARFVLFGLLLALPGMAFSYTADDIAQAKGDVAQIKKIVDDEASDNEVRVQAWRTLSEAQAGAYFGSAFYRANPALQSSIVYIAAKSDTLPLDGYPEALRVALDSEYWNYLLLVQYTYIRKLVEARRSGEALLESKRLLGLTHLEAVALSSNLSMVAGAIKADALSKGKSLPAAVVEANSYLEAVNKGDVKGQAHTALAYPATAEDLQAFTTDARPGVAILALLYAGRYQEAQAKAETLLAMAGDNASLERAVHLAGAAMNGRAGLPTAANVLLQPKAQQPAAQ